MAELVVEHGRITWGGNSTRLLNPRSRKIKRTVSVGVETMRSSLMLQSMA